MQPRKAQCVIFLFVVSHRLARAVQTQPSSSFACYGSTPAQKACLFSNVYYSIDNNTFHLVTADVVDPGLVQENIELGPDYSLTTSSYTPETAAVLIQSDLNVFWTFWHHGAAYSLGHAFLHELFPIYVVMSNLLGEDLPIAFNLVSTSGSLPAVFDHVSAATKGRVVNWPELRSSAQASGKSWIWFESAIMGHGGIPPVAYELSAARHPPPSFFNNLRWLGFRKWMLRAAGVDPERRPSAVSIVINDKHTMDTFYNGSTDRRRILNIKDLEQHLTAAFPDAQVSSVKFLNMTWRAQLQVMSSCTVFVTTEGSSSFRYLFLPTGASAIIVAHPDNMTAGATTLAAEYPFHEIDKFFSISYIHFLKYRVDIRDTNEYEVFVKEGLPYVYRLYNSHIIVKVQVVERMVRTAIQLYGMQQSLNHVPVA